jgi:hypothetical protein
VAPDSDAPNANPVGESRSEPQQPSPGNIRVNRGCNAGIKTRPEIGMNPSPTELGIWLSVFAVIVGLGANVALVIGTFRTQRRHVRLEDNFATVPELDKMELKMESVRSEMK